MKILFFAIIQLMTVSLLACPNFSGNYIRDYDGQDIFISQPNCDKITYSINGHDFYYLIDGQERLISKYDIEGSEPGSIISTVEIYQARTFKGKTLVTNARSVTSYPDSHKIEERKSVAKAVYDKDKNIVVTTVAEDGSSFEQTYLRVK